MSSDEVVEKLLQSKVIEIIVKTGTKESSILFDEARKVFVVKTKAPPEDGKANAEVLKLIKKATGRDAKIISGATSKKKLVKLA